MFQLEVGDEWCSSGLCAESNALSGPLLLTCAVRLSAPQQAYRLQKLSGTADTTEGQEDIQRDLEKLEEWAHENLMKFYKCKDKVRQRVRANPDRNTGL